MNDTITSGCAERAGSVNIPNARQINATIDQIDAMYRRPELKDTYLYKLVPEAIMKVKNPDYDLESWVEGMKHKLITSKGN